MMSASTCPGPTEGSWSTSPTRISAARRGTALSSACSSGTSTIETSSTTSRSASSGCSSWRLKPPWAGSASSSRCRVLASRPVASLIRLAARPVGAASAMAGVLARRICRMVLTSVVLPTPGPPVITSTLARSASRTASRWLSARVIPALRSAQGIACSGSTAGQGGRPARSRRSRSAMPCSARCSPARNTHGAALDRVGHHRPLGELQRQGRVDHLGRDLEQLGGERSQLVGGQAAVALVHGLGQRVGDPGPGADHRRLLDPEPHRDLVGALEADAADVARQPVGVLARSPGRHRRRRS